MDLLDIAILLLRLALLVLLYGLVLAVVRAANRLLDGAGPERSAAVARGRTEQPRERRIPPSGEPSTLRLLVRAAGESELAAGQRLAVPDGGVLGRSADAAVVLGDPTISAEHARIWHDGADRWLIEDLGSTNGTLVNGARVRTRRAVEPGDRLTLGSIELEVEQTAR